MTNSINWFEIPVKDFKRAKMFYGVLFNADIVEMPHPNGIISVILKRKGANGVIADINMPPNVSCDFIWNNQATAIKSGLQQITIESF